MTPQEAPIQKGKYFNVQKLATIAGHKDCVYALEPENAESSCFFSACGNGQIAYWDQNQPQEGKLLAQVGASCYALHYLPEKQELLIGENFEGIHLVDVASREEKASLKFTEAAIFDIKLVGDKILAATGDGNLAVINYPELSLQEVLSYSENSARVLAIAPNQKEVAIGFSDYTIRVVDAESFKINYQLEGHKNSVFALAYHPRGDYLVSGSRDARLKFWDPLAGYALIHTVPAHMYAINDISFSPNARYFATCSMDKSVKVWDAETFKLLRVIDKARHAGHGTSVNKLFWSPATGYIIAASDDRNISVWNLIKNSEDTP